MREGIMKHKQEHIAQINKRSTYNTINLHGKYINNNTFSNQLLMKSYHSCENSSNKNYTKMFRDQLTNLNEEMKNVDKNLGEFLDVISNDYNGMVFKADNMERSMIKITEERFDAQ